MPRKKITQKSDIDGNFIDLGNTISDEDLTKLDDVPNKLEATNIVAGDNITVSIEGNNVTISSTASGGSSGVSEEVVDEKIANATTNLVPNTRTINGKALSEDITLTASDVGAMPIDGTVTNVTFSLSGTTLTITPITEE